MFLWAFKKVLLTQQVSAPPANGKVASNVAFGTAAIIGIPGNILVLFAIIYSRDMRTLSNIFIFNLALADLFLLLGTPILIVQSVTVMGLAIVISYTLFYLPFWAVQWSIELNLSWIHNRNWLIPLSYFAYALLYINSALNPFLCVFFTDTFIQKVFRRQKDPYPALHKRSAFETAVYAPVANPQTGRPPLVHAPRQDIVL
uniref:G_PROTEIN_RECEP_F1_2 domain-containing protein n=1 Tax=Panagrellus redivivus TaxID=6233 RepID=A0A7E4VQH8_PANRE